MNEDRRHFMKSAAAAAAATAALPRRARAADATDRLVVGLIGPGGMGMHHLRLLAGYGDVVVGYVCDPDETRRAAAANAVREISGAEPKAVADMREVIDDKEVDAVVIATPDHWHAPATVLACQAGKHVYVEKPASHNFREGRLMIEAAREHDRIVQIGTQSRSTATVREGIDRLRDGAIGEILVAKAWNSQLRSSIGTQAPADPPPHIDYDLWLGPAPFTPYQSNKLHGVWRWWFDYGCGDIGNDGVHDLDIARWGLGVDEHPTRVAALGGKYFFDDDQEWPDTQSVVFEFAAGDGHASPRQIVFEQRIWAPYDEHGSSNGNAFYGTKGSMILSKSSGWKLYGARNELVEEREGGVDLEAHHRNWIDAIRGGGSPHADATEGHRSAALCHLANIATRLGRTIEFDPANEEIRNDAEAADLLGREYRDGHWATPV